MAIIIDKKVYQPYETKMQKSIEVLQQNLNTIRAGRANPRVLDQVTVQYYGVDTPLSQVANIQVPEPRQITVQPWDATLLKDIERAIQSSDLGINPVNDGKLIRLSFPPLTEERRRDLVKQTRSFGEDTKVAIRNVRREFLDQAKSWLKSKEIGEDNFKDAEEGIQKVTDTYITRVDDVLAAKEKDLMEI